MSRHRSSIRNHRTTSVMISTILFSSLLAALSSSSVLDLPVANQVFANVTAQSIVDQLREEFRAPINFIGAGDDTRATFTVSQGTIMDVLEQLVAQIPEYRFVDISGRIVVYPQASGYDSIITLPSSQYVNVPRWQAAVNYVAEMTRQMPGLRNLLPPPLIGNPNASLYADTVTLSESAPILQHLVQLLAVDPDVSFFVGPAPSGLPMLYLLRFPGVGEQRVACDTCYPSGLVYTGETQVPIPPPGGGAAIGYNILGVTCQCDCAGAVLTETVTRDSGCLPGTFVQVGPPQTVGPGNTFLNGYDIFYLIALPEAFPMGTCIETFTQQMYICGRLVETAQMVFTITRTVTGATGIGTRTVLSHANPPQIVQIDDQTFSAGQIRDVALHFTNPAATSIALDWSIDGLGNGFTSDPTQGTITIPPLSPATAMISVTCNAIGTATVTLSSTNGCRDSAQFVGKQGACMAYILDRSGSMSGAPLANAKAAANQGITTMHEGDEVAVVSFNSAATVNFARAPITSDAVRTQARAAVNGLVADGTTSIGAGLQTAYNQLLNSNLTDRDYLLLSDGLENTPPWAADVLPLFLNLNRDPITHHIHAIAYGPGADQALMSELAGVTGGVFLYSPGTNDPLALADLFFTIQTAVFDEQRLATYSGTISAPSNITYPYEVTADISSTTVSLLWDLTGTQLSLQIQMPDGSWIDASNWTSYPGVMRVGGPGIEYFTISSPAQGDWNARVVANSGTVDYALVITAQTTVQMDVEFDHDAYPTHTPIVITAALTEGAVPITGASVSAEVEVPTAAMRHLSASYERAAEKSMTFDLFRSEDGRRQVGSDGVTYFITIDLPMVDDGAHGDGEANDGIYGGVFTDTDQTGSYRFHVLAEGTTSSGIHFYRESSRSTAVNPNTVLTFDLTIRSSDPDSGVPIDVSPVDHYSQGGGTTEFARIFEDETVVTVTAPEFAPGGHRFHSWLVDGVTQSADRVIQITMDQVHVVTATYGEGCNWTDWRDIAQQAISHATSWGDYDNDGDPDLLVAGIGLDHLYENVGGVMTEVLGWSGDADPSYGAAWGDYDSDADLDLFIVNSGVANALYRNDGGVFTRVDAGDAADPSGDGYNAAWADIDNDGDLDLYICNRYGTNHLYLNANGVMVHNGGVTEVSGTSRGCAFADYDNDGDQDLYVSMQGANYLFRNDGGFYVDISAPPLNDSGDGKGVAWGDYDNDGDLDLYLVNMDGANKLFRNDLPGFFTDVTDAVAGDTNNGRACAWADYDNDGWLDLFLTNFEGGNRMFKNIGSAFADSTCGAIAATSALPSWGCAFADYDLDGDQDLSFAVADQSDPSKLIRNDLVVGPNRHWLQVDLRGVSSNRYGVGAKILVDNGEFTQMREVSASGNYLSQSPLTACFGLAAATHVDIRVIWPSGIVQDLENVQVNRQLTVYEGAGATPVEELAIPAVFDVINYPNPFNPTTTIEFALPSEVVVSLQILDARGRQVTSLISDRPYAAGRHAVQWNGLDDYSRALPSGVYYYRCSAGVEIKTGRMLLLK
jgi:hypothetical protein